MDSSSANFHVVFSGNNDSLITPCLAYQFDLDDAITMPENPSLMIPFLSHQFELDEAITMSENPQARQQELASLVSDMPEVNHAAGSCSVCMESFEKSEETARRISCGHVYHHNCITGWLLNGKSNSCPLCRHEISG